MERFPSTPRGRTQERKTPPARTGESRTISTQGRTRFRVRLRSEPGQRLGPSKGRSSPPTVTRSPRFRRRCAPVACTEPDLVELAVERRAADPQPPRDLGHLPAIARDERIGSPRPRSLPVEQTWPSASVSSQRVSGSGRCRAAGARSLVEDQRGRLARIVCGMPAGTIAAPRCASPRDRAAEIPARRSRHRRPARRRGRSRSRAGGHIAGPRMRVSRPSASAEHGADALAFFGREPHQEVPHQFRDVLGALAQGRHRDRKDVQAIEQVLAEAAVGHVGDQVAVGRRDDAHVDLDGLAFRRPGRPRLPAWRAAA